MTFDELCDILAAVSAERDQEERAFGEALGLSHGLRLDAMFLVSPDIGMRLTREGYRPDRVRISWALPPGSVYAVDPTMFASVMP